ncbi:DNA-binding transcriptional MerR regulator [Deinobacterium chartae]|uniref:DNA-binding transcriptional MerR regulator n=1 Tax=Deinobacterium chartae TaxID=521158 RepID=A0A841HY67_9DEIO|nr:MerR family DNA-binding transcriptional regulator [Deinobacterium chartae]MBB6096878.1 DNA-binding transcriptional MerR regulator [Deinobacterium chartae]
MSPYSISDLAHEFDVTPRALRFYEEQGLLNPERDGQQRTYSARDRARLKLILRGKRLGFSLAEIRQMLDAYSAPGSETEQLKAAVRLGRQHIRTLETQLDDLQALLSDLRGFEEQFCELLRQKGLTDDDLARL